MWYSACEIRGRLRCSAASVGYRGRIWKAFIHSLVTPLSRNPCQARNYHRRGIPADQGRGRELRACAPVPRSANWIHLCAECAFVAFAWSLPQLPAGSAPPRVAFDSSTNRPRARSVRPPQAASGFSSRDAPWPGGVFPCFPKKQENTGEGGWIARFDGDTKRRVLPLVTGGLRPAPVA